MDSLFPIRTYLHGLQMSASPVSWYAIVPLYQPLFQELIDRMGLVQSLLLPLRYCSCQVIPLLTWVYSLHSPDPSQFVCIYYSNIPLRHSVSEERSWEFFHCTTESRKCLDVGMLVGKAVM